MSFRFFVLLSAVGQIKTLTTQMACSVRVLTGWLRKLMARLNIHISTSRGAAATKLGYKVDRLDESSLGHFPLCSSDIIDQRSHDFDKYLYLLF